MNNNPLIMQQLLQNFRNQQQVQSQQLDPRVALQNNLDNRLAFQRGTLEQQRDINQINHPELYNLGVNLNNIHPVLGETYRDWVYNPLTNTSAPYGTFNNNVPGSTEPQYSRLLVPEEKIKEWESRSLKQGIEKLKGSPTGGAAPIGQYGIGNIDLYNRPVIKNPDGSISTVRSMSFNDGRNEVLIPTVSPTGIMTPQEAINRYRQTGEYLGKFNTPEEANEYAQRLHEEQANLYK